MADRRSLYLAFTLFCVLGLTHSLIDQEALQKNLKTLQQKLESSKVEHKALVGLGHVLQENLKPVLDFLDKETPDVPSLLVVKQAVNVLVESAKSITEKEAGLKAQITHLEENMKIQEEQMKILEKFHAEL